MRKVLSFKLAGELFGIEISNIKEINRKIEYSVVPRAPETIVGLFNMRGQIVTLFNLAKILGYEEGKSNEISTCIILKSLYGDTNHKGFLIDRSGDVVDVEDNDCELPPANMEAQQLKYIKSVVRLKDELLRIVEPDLIFNF